MLQHQDTLLWPKLPSFDELGGVKMMKTFSYPTTSIFLWHFIYTSLPLLWRQSSVLFLSFCTFVTACQKSQMYLSKGLHYSSLLQIFPQNLRLWQLQQPFRCLEKNVTQDEVTTSEQGSPKTTQIQQNCRDDDLAACRQCTHSRNLLPQRSHWKTTWA